MLLFSNAFFVRPLRSLCLLWLGFLFLTENTRTAQRYFMIKPSYSLPKAGDVIMLSLAADIGSLSETAPRLS